MDNKYDEELVRRRKRWHAKLAPTWFVVMLIIGSWQKHSTQIEWDKKGLWGHLVGQSPDSVFGDWFAFGLFGAALMYFPSRALAKNEVRELMLLDEEKALGEAAARNRQDAEDRKKRHEQEASQQVISHRVYSVQQVILLLGNIDQFVRVLASERDANRRIIALQSAQSAVTTLESRVAAGELDQSALSHPQARTHASETLHDLDRLGLSEDRLARDIRRLFAF
jgi:hypothetical protein